MSYFSEHSWCCKRGELGAAERRLLEEAIELQPGHSPVLNVLSTFLASRGRLAEAQHYAHSALAAYDAVLQRSPNLDEACLGEGSCPASFARRGNRQLWSGDLHGHTGNGSGKVVRIRENLSEMQKLIE